MRTASRFFLVLALALAGFAPAVARAAPPCLQNDNPCDPDKLCTFKASLAEKVLIYQIYLRNSQKTKRMGKRDGVRYRGDLYDAAMSEARTALPNGSASEISERAGAIFQEKVREQAEEKFRLPTCRLGGVVNNSLLPKEGYKGMFTNSACQVFANYQGGEYDAAGFGANDATQCPEFYDRDRAHESIHKKRCDADKAAGVADREGIDAVIEEEIKAYEHSVRLTKAYVTLLAYQCSSQETPEGLRTRARAIENLLAPYRTKAGG